jgi:hypothetical protein
VSRQSADLHGPASLAVAIRQRRSTSWRFVVPMLPTVILIGLAATTLATEVSKEPVFLTVPHAQNG